MEAFQRQERKKRLELYELNQENGRIEYILSWNIFWDEIIPEVYAACKKNYYHRNVGIYDFDFELEGVLLYGLDPADEAVRRAKDMMPELGRDRYVKYLEWDERGHKLSDLTIKNMHETCWSDAYRRPDVTWSMLLDDNFTVQFKNKEYRAPSEEDYRRYYYVRSNDDKLIPLKSEHISSYFTWRTPENKAAYLYYSKDKKNKTPLPGTAKHFPIFRDETIQPEATDIQTPVKISQKENQINSSSNQEASHQHPAIEQPKSTPVFRSRW